MELDLPLGHFRIDLVAETPIGFNHYAGSAWRGLFGHALKQSVCIMSTSECPRCVLYRQCAYSYLFETPPPEDTRFMRKATAAPHPFVLRPDMSLRRIAPGEHVHLYLQLAGNGVAYLPYVIHALERAGSQGIGSPEGTYRLVGVSQEDGIGSENWVARYPGSGLGLVRGAPVELPDLPEQVSMKFITPTRLRHQKRMVTVDRFSLSAVVSALLRRYSMASYFHNRKVYETDFRGVIDQAATVNPLHKALRWYDWQRYSSRQHRKIRMGGLLGEVTFRGKDLEAFWPLLWIGQWLHVGKGASMGMGGYRLQPLSASANLGAPDKS